MSDTFDKMMETYIKSYIKSEQGQSIMKNTMISYINKQCIVRLTTFNDEATDPFSFGYRPFEQIKIILEHCDNVSKLLEKTKNQDKLDILSDIAIRIYDCCKYLSQYVTYVQYEETPQTKEVDELIQKNRIALDIVPYLPENLSNEADEHKYNEQHSSSIHAKTASKPTYISKEEFFALDDETIYNEPYSGPERADISILRKYGYSVGKDNAMSDSKRQELLHTLINKKLVSKGYVISYLKHMIQINGKRGSNYIALTKWKSDLEYVLKL